MAVLAGLSRRVISSVLLAGALASSGCLPKADLTEYSEDWSSALGGSGGAGAEPPPGDGLGGAGSPSALEPADGGPMQVDTESGGSGGGLSSTPSGDTLDAGGESVVDAADATALRDACADASSPGCSP